jgi:hypothetical protein
MKSSLADDDDDDDDDDDIEAMMAAKAYTNTNQSNDAK